MSVNLLIGLGGTGAKAVESALMASLAGLGPEAMTVGFVDQDEFNGNVKRSRALLQKLIQFRVLWGQQPGRPDHLEWRAGSQPDSVVLGSTVLSVLDPPLWCPNPEQGSNLGGIFGPRRWRGETSPCGVLWTASMPRPQRTFHGPRCRLPRPTPHWRSGHAVQVGRAREQLRPRPVANPQAGAIRS